MQNYIPDPDFEYGSFVESDNGVKVPIMDYNILAIARWLKGTNRDLKPGEMLTKDELEPFKI